MYVLSYTPGLGNDKGISGAHMCAGILAVKYDRVLEIALFNSCRKRSG